MKVYLVRNIETNGILGIYWSERLIGLWRTIDEIANPAFYEYTELKISGGLAFPDDEPTAVNMEELTEIQTCTENHSIPWGNAEESDNFHNQLYGSKKLRWKIFPVAVRMQALGLKQ